MKKIMTKQETQKSVITSREDVASFVQIPPQSDHPNANFKVFAEKGEEILEVHDTKQYDIIFVIYRIYEYIYI